MFVIRERLKKRSFEVEFGFGFGFGYTLPFLLLLLLLNFGLVNAGKREITYHVVFMDDSGGHG